MKEHKMYSDEEKEKALGCLRYECNMLQLTAGCLLRGEENRVLKNALIESFLIHARALIEFLEKEISRPKDTILAVEFFEQPEQWIAARGSMPSILSDTKGDAHKWLAHISIKRQEAPAKKKWPYPKITNEILKLVAIFEKTGNVTIGYDSVQIEPCHEQDTASSGVAVGRSRSVKVK